MMFMEDKYIEFIYSKSQRMDLFINGAGLFHLKGIS